MSTPNPNPSTAANPAATQVNKNKIRRNLKTRHLSMIAIGGSIGTGLFMASGSAIHMAGPGGALVAYAAIGLMVYFLMTSLGEMATHLPVSGSFPLMPPSLLIPRWVMPWVGTIGLTG